MLKSPALYGVGADYEDDVGLVQKRADIIHSAAVLLGKSQLVKYERAS
jgi:pre-mRNA-splicing helicase BRR2